MWGSFFRILSGSELWESRIPLSQGRMELFPPRLPDGSGLSPRGCLQMRLRVMERNGAELLVEELSPSAVINQVAWMRSQSWDSRERSTKPGSL